MMDAGCGRLTARVSQEAMAGETGFGVPPIWQDAVRLLEEREAKLSALREALKEGEESGRADYSLQSLIAQLDGECSH